MAAKTGRHAIIDQLRADDVTHVIGNPGTVEQGFLDALLECPDVEYMLSLPETTIAGIADGYARATKKPTVAQLHSGLVLGNGIGMLSQAEGGHTGSW